MLIGDVRPSTVKGIKRLANRIRKERGIKHTNALEFASRAAGYEGYRHARRKLPTASEVALRSYVLLTVYWRDTRSHRAGRETLEVQLSRPILDICGKSALKRVRGFGNTRMVADDHFVSDVLAPSQEIARNKICTAERSLRFMEYTGLLPSRPTRKAYPEVAAENKLPNRDHTTNWIDPTSGQFILIDEPYGGVPDEAKRAAWATRYGWRIMKSSWPGMYNPYACDLYVASDARDGYDIEALLTKIDAIPAPLLTQDWAGDSAPSLEVFISPSGKSPQDRRRARSKGTVWPKATKTSLPYTGMLGDARRRPKGTMSLEGHIEMGRIIKTVMNALHRPYGVYKRMDAVRSTLEDWMGLEIRRDRLNDRDFFDVYYHDADSFGQFFEMSKSVSGLIDMLHQLKKKLQSEYMESSPLKGQIYRIDSSISLLENAKVRLRQT